MLTGQALSLVSHQIFIPASKTPDTMLSLENAMLIDLVIVLSLTGVNMVFLHHFIKKRIYFWTMLLLVGLSVALNFTSTLLKLDQLNFGTFRLVFGLATFFNITVLSFSFYCAVRDIFGERVKILQALLGAANIYLLIGSIFAFFYVSLNIIMPGTIVPNEEVSSLYHTCMMNSSYILGGIDIPANTYPQSIRNCMVFESLFAHLFAVFIVGRLLGKQS